MIESSLLRSHAAESSLFSASAKDASVFPKWYAVFTSSHHEKRVKFHFEQRGIEHFLPIYYQDRKWKNGLKVKLALPLFPNYIFARFTWPQRLSVLEVPSAHRIVGGTGREPEALSDTEIQMLQSSLAQRNAEPHALLTSGQRVRIQSGAFAGMHGVVLRTKGCVRVVITIEVMMRSVSVEVDESEVEPLRD